MLGRDNDKILSVVLDLEVSGKRKREWPKKTGRRRQKIGLNLKMRHIGVHGGSSSGRK